MNTEREFGVLREWCGAGRLPTDRLRLYRTTSVKLGVRLRNIPARSDQLVPGEPELVMNAPRLVATTSPAVICGGLGSNAATLSWTQPAAR